MPWKEICAMDERVGFIAAHQFGLYSMTELCALFGISRKTGYKWLDRYAAAGPAGLAERSHAPLHPAHVTPTAIAQDIIDFKRAHSSWGPRKLVARLKEKQPHVSWPSGSTAGEILKRAGLVAPRKVRRRTPVHIGALTLAERPNHLWAVDHKGWIRLRDGSRCEPLTITDSFSRYLIGVDATPNTREEEARPRFERAFHEFGLPDIIRSDNGSPFASASVTGLTQLSVWWTKLGLVHERIEPGHPQQNGRHERMHLTLLEAMSPASANQNEQNQRFEAFKREYNEERPHEALGQKPPGRFYQPSPRQMPKRILEPEYPKEAAVRQVRSNGEIKWRGDLLSISTALTGETVCVEETEFGEWRVRFYARTLGVIDRKSNRLRPVRVFKDAIGPQAEPKP